MKKKIQSLRNAPFVKRVPYKQYKDYMYAGRVKIEFRFITQIDPMVRFC